jgi:hypothetical protein
VSATFVPDSRSKDAGECQFALISNPASMLRIQVTILGAPKTQFSTYLAKCGPDAKPLKGIGNEAVICAIGREQRVIGRVRDQAFLITLVPAETVAAEAAREATRKAADIVAGNLF